MVAMAATIKLHKMTQDDSEEHEGGEETRRDESSEGNNREENNREEANEHEQLVYETDGGYEHETHAHRDEQQELEDGECRIYKRKGLELGEDEIHEPRELEWEPARGNVKVGNGLHEAKEGEDYEVREPNAPHTISHSQRGCQTSAA